MKHITWQAGDIITDEKWNNIQNNYQLKFRHFNIPFTTVEINNESTTVEINNESVFALNTTETILKDKINNGYICYFMQPFNIDGNGNYIYYLKKIQQLSDSNDTIARVIKSGNETTIDIFYSFYSYSNDITIWFQYDAEQSKLIQVEDPNIDSGTVIVKSEK